MDDLVEESGVSVGFVEEVTSSSTRRLRRGKRNRIHQLTVDFHLVMDLLTSSSILCFIQRRCFREIVRHRRYDIYAKCYIHPSFGMEVSSREACFDEWVSFRFVVSGKTSESKDGRRTWNGNFVKISCGLGMSWGKCTARG